MVPRRIQLPGTQSRQGGGIAAMVAGGTFALAVEAVEALHVPFRL